MAPALKPECHLRFASAAVSILQQWGVQQALSLLAAPSDSRSWLRTIWRLIAEGLAGGNSHHPLCLQGFRSCWRVCVPVDPRCRTHTTCCFTQRFHAGRDIHGSCRQHSVPASPGLDRSITAQLNG